MLRSGTFDHLVRSGNRFVLLVRGADRLAYYQKNFSGEHVLVDLLPPAVTTAERFWYFLGWNSLPTRAAVLRRHIYRAKGWPQWKFVLGSILGFLGQFRLWRDTVRTIYTLLPDNYAHEMFERYKPDLLFLPNMFSPEDFRLMRQAKRRKIPTVTTAKSWDVLTTKAFTRVKADRLLVFNEFNRDEAISIGDYDPHCIVVTGFPQFDVYAREEVYQTRDEFFRDIGADPSKRLVLIAVPGDWKTPHTKEIMQELDKRIDEGRFPFPLQVLARFHPKYSDSSEGLALKHFIFDRPGMLLSEKREFSVDMGVSGTFAWTFTDRDIARLANSMRHADIVINTESTLTLDAAANDTPSILIAYDGKATLPYWDSVARVYEREHYQNVVRTGAAPLVCSDDELEQEITRFLSDRDYRARERAVLKEKLLFKTDGHSAERVARAVLDMLTAA